MKSVIPDLMSSIRSRVRLLETKSQVFYRFTQEVMLDVETTNFCLYKKPPAFHVCTLAVSQAYFQA